MCKPKWNLAANSICTVPSQYLDLRYVPLTIRRKELEVRTGHHIQHAEGSTHGLWEIVSSVSMTFRKDWEGIGHGLYLGPIPAVAWSDFGKSGWPDRELNPGPPECESTTALRFGCALPFLATYLSIAIFPRTLQPTTTTTLFTYSYSVHAPGCSKTCCEDHSQLETALLELETAFFEWFSQRAADLPIRGSVIKAKATELALRMKIEDFVSAVATCFRHAGLNAYPEIQEQWEEGVGHRMKRGERELSYKSREACGIDFIIWTWSVSLESTLKPTTMFGVLAFAMNKDSSSEDEDEAQGKAAQVPRVVDVLETLDMLSSFVVWQVLSEPLKWHGIKEYLDTFLGNLPPHGLYASSQSINSGCWRTVMNKSPTNHIPDVFDGQHVRRTCRPGKQ
ncbi:hypothetical protein PR048_014514 [Dryococelus australis]|uniref:Uncharacterized protein n=1 Tax=Dryococelus australis TaxID=614101 RepID=A0ABQ9HEF7_9NEOP|nr:hypothetical protein PR048_014514 [Dryococelus australis]